MTNDINIIVAVDEKNGIGKNGGLPWALSGDMKHFKEITCKTSSSDKRNIVIMGRKTWESIPEKYRPLPGRINMILTRSKDFKTKYEDVIVAHSLADALEMSTRLCSEGKAENVFAIGGQQIFSEVISNESCKVLYITHIKSDFQCDTFFPDFNEMFVEEHCSEKYSENNIEYFYSQYNRISS